jgi:hypothetical protein
VVSKQPPPKIGAVFDHRAQNQGGLLSETGEIGRYFEDSNLQSDIGFGPRDHFEIACN